MLGAQALRTKQKMDEKERKKRERDRQQKLEMQRQSIQNAANEEAMLSLEFAAQQAAALNGHSNFHPHGKPHQRHSLHTTVFNDHLVSARDGSHGSQIEITQHRLPPRSPSTDYTSTKEESSSGGNRLFKWLGLSSNNHKKHAKRRMSTY